jgi:hypothetical protein
MDRCILWPQNTSSSLPKYQVCKDLSIDSGKNQHNCFSCFMSVWLKNGAIVSKGSSFLRCDAVLLEVQLLTFQRTVVPSPSASSSPSRIIYSFLYLLSLESKVCQTATIINSQTQTHKASHASVSDFHILILLCCIKTFFCTSSHIFSKCQPWN